MRDPSGVERHSRFAWVDRGVTLSSIKDGGVLLFKREAERKRAVTPLAQDPEDNILDAELISRWSCGRNDMHKFLLGRRTRTFCWTTGAGVNSLNLLAQPPLC